MILIFGGVYQGKLTYAMEVFGCTDEQVYHCSDKNTSVPCDKKVVYEIDRWILALVQTEANIPEQVTQFMKENREAIVICNDISCGVVPTDNTLRKWREETGRALTMLAEQSKEVIRLFCGIPTRIK